METSTPNPGSGSETAINEAAVRFFELLKTFGAVATGPPSDWSSLAAPLAAQFEQWLRLSQSPGPWTGSAAGLSAVAMPSAAWPFAALPLGSAATPGNDLQRTFELLARLGQLHAQLAVHWGEVARTAAQRFVARVGGTAAAAGTADQALKLYELWVNCAEEAYAATVHGGDFSRLQADIANTSAALLVEQRRAAEALARALGLPTRSELDALGAQLRELRRELTGRSEAPPSATAAPARSRTKSAGKAARGAGGPKRTQPRSAARSAAGRRTRLRRPRR